MTTKVIILGETPNEVKKKPIEFVKVLYSSDDGHRVNDVLNSSPDHFINIELICRHYGGGGYDLMFAYDDNRRMGKH